MNMKTTKIDKRKAYKLMVDVETTMCPTNQQIVFDLGFAVFTKSGDILEQYSFVIAEVFDDYKMMEKAYYFKKYPLYLEGLQTGKFVKVPWKHALATMHQVIQKYNIKEVSAYNLAFDLRALEETNKFLRPERVFQLFNGMATNDLWGMTTETVCQQKAYKNFCHANNLISPSGKFLSSKAETVYAYMTNNPSFEEEHTGLADVLIEIEIYKLVMRQKKKMTKGVWYHPFMKVKIED